MAEYLINDTTLAAIADAIRNKTGSTDVIAVSDMASSIEAIVSGGGDDSNIGRGAYNVKVIDYDGTVLVEKNLDEGATFTLPDAPAHDGLVFDGWSSPVDITENIITVRSSNIMIGPMYHTASGATEIDIALTKVTGLTFTFLASRLTGMTSIDWGDGTTGSTLTHTYSDYGEYTIKIYGMTAIATGSTSGGIVSGTNYTIYAVRFASVVTRIGNYAFYNCISLTNVIIPKGVTSIGNYAFRGCNSLTNAIIPEGVTSISQYAFNACYCLTSIIIPKTVTSIGLRAFLKCYSLASAIIPEGVTSIGGYSFNSCYSLTNVIIPKGVTSIENYTFTLCTSLTNVIIPKGVTSIGTYAFNGCSSLIEYDFTTHTSVPALSNIDAFTSINGRSQILIPSALYDTWITATNWATYADHIVAV